ncbi:MAG: discoidin domain-containing protein [Lachnospiraceae bacterium]|nr:discoidin domain-containing protein [Lachnospiraceae bacterium]
MNKILAIIFSAAIIISLVAAGVLFFTGTDKNPNLTIVKATDQTEITRPPGFPDPMEFWIKLPDGENLALGKSVSSGAVTEIYDAGNVVDDDTNTYWESSGFPGEIVIDLEEIRPASTVVVRLNPNPIWEARTQGFAVHVSVDGTNFSAAAEDARYDFDPATGNLARADFDSAEARYVKLIFSMNSASRSQGAQAAEIMVFE